MMLGCAARTVVSLSARRAMARAAWLARTVDVAAASVSIACSCPPRLPVSRACSNEVTASALRGLCLVQLLDRHIALKAISGRSRSHRARGQCFAGLLVARCVWSLADQRRGSLRGQDRGAASPALPRRIQDRPAPAAPPVDGDRVDLEQQVALGYLVLPGHWHVDDASALPPRRALDDVGIDRGVIGRGAPGVAIHPPRCRRPAAMISSEISLAGGRCDLISAKKMRHRQQPGGDRDDQADGDADKQVERQCLGQPGCQQGDPAAQASGDSEHCAQHPGGKRALNRMNTRDPCAAQPTKA